MKYKINEIFYSIQGEGARTGTANIFIRFSGCNLKCWFCDTKHEQYDEYSIDEIINKIRGYSCKNVILTGGEPTIQDIKPLINKLKSKNYFIAIETNGMLSTKKMNLDWITVSPKDFINGDYISNPPNEIKIIVTEKNNIEKCCHCQYYYLQPEGNKKENIQRSINYIKENPEWRLSLQLQKILDIK